MLPNYTTSRFQLEKVFGVDKDSVILDREMKVRSSGNAGHADCSNDIALFNPVPLFYKDLVKMPIVSCEFAIIMQHCDG